MQNTVISDILEVGLRQGIMPEKTKAARDWYQQTARSYGATIRQGGKEAGRIDYARLNEKKFVAQDSSRLTTRIVPGKVYMGIYQAKWADELPYWDKCPIFIPFRVQSDRFWSLNLHYLDLRNRAIVLDHLLSYATNKNYDENTKLKFSYQMLNAAANNKFFKPCVKQYLFAQMRSQFMTIQPYEFSIAAFLPLERFQKKTRSQVWADTKRKVR